MGINSGKNSIKLSKFNLILYDLNTNGGECGCGGDMSRGELTSTQLKVASQLSNQNPYMKLSSF